MMAIRNGNTPEKRGSKQGVTESTNGFHLKSPDYEPTQEELEADVSLPASFDEVMDALFASDREVGTNLQQRK